MHKPLAHVSLFVYRNDMHNATRGNKMTYSDLYAILIEAEQRSANTSLPDDVRVRSQETVDICLIRLRHEQITRDQLKRLARAN